MKKTFLVVAAGLILTACQSKQGEDTTVTSDEALTESSSTVPATYSAPSEGDVKVVDSKAMVYRNGEWVVITTDVTLSDGSVVSADGKVVKDGNTMQLTEGEVVTETGNFFDKTGNAVSNAWDATKEGVKDAWDATKEGAKDAGEAIEKGADKVGDKTKEVVNDLKN